jgi:threonyl-tRNA synthetase
MKVSIKHNNSSFTLSKGDQGLHLLKQLPKETSSQIVAFKRGKNLLDVRDELFDQDELEIVLKTDPQGQEILRHSTAHLMATALQKLFPGTQNAIGPVKDEIFFYDVQLPKGQRFSEKDLPQLEKEMRRLIKKAPSLIKKTLSKEEALELFQDQSYKKEIIQNIPENEAITVYELDDWVDLCSGPHVPKISHLKFFKLLTVSGAYWKNQSTQHQLDRLTGTAWATEEELKDYLFFLEEAKKRDHVKIGKELDLFEVHPDLSPGCPFFYPRGFFLKSMLADYMRSLLRDPNYQEVETPQVYKLDVWKTSGHAEHFKDDMFFIKRGSEEESIEALKPMNCPGHIRIFQKQTRSYRDLPLRLCEFGVVHRNELSGTLHGLTRVRRFAQDDAHIFCTKEQILSEIQDILKKIQKLSQDFEMKNVSYKLSTRPDHRLGDEASWDLAEKALEDALNHFKLPYEINEGDGAFYGPKIDFYFQDSFRRWHQCSTVQLDFLLAQRFQIVYTDSQNQKQHPVVIHRALIGSLERFLGIYLESCAGHIHPGLQPEQVRILPISQAHLSYASEIQSQLQAKGLRVGLDDASDKLSSKIKQALSYRIPYLIILGDQELETKSFQVRTRSQEKKYSSIESLFEDIKASCEPFWDLSFHHRKTFQP